MGTKYQSQAVSGYNSAPPPDNGAQSAANKISWATIKTKLPDPILSLAQSMNTALLTALDVSNTTEIANYTTNSADHLRPIEVSSGATISLASAASVGVGYQVTVVNTDLTLSSVVALALGTNTFDGSVGGSVTLAAGQSITVAVNASIDGYYTISRGWGRGGLIVSDVVRFDAAVSVTAGLTLTGTGDVLLVSTGNARFNELVNIGSGSIVSGKALTVASPIGDYAELIQGTHGSNPFGLQINFPNASPNGTGNYFFLCNDSSATRIQGRSNGGIGNFQSFNVDLSDADAKTGISALSSAAMTAQDDLVKALQYKTFSYADDPSGCVLTGLIAQDVQLLNPALVGEFSAGQLGIYTQQLQAIINASLIRRVAALEAA